MMTCIVVMLLPPPTSRSISRADAELLTIIGGNTRDIDDQSGIAP